MTKQNISTLIVLTIIGLCTITTNVQSAGTTTDDIKIDKTAALLTINGDPVTVQEFENIYKKNNTSKVEGSKEKDLKEYLELFNNYKLKVKEAETVGLDTTRAFIKEFTNYRKQLAKPYMVSNEIIDKLIEDVYSRMQKEVKASHILIKVSPTASPSDTLRAYRKIMGIRKRIISRANFGKVAAEMSEDPTAKKNKGDLGWFTAFRMVYDFETAAFNTPTGEVSMPVKTRFGYHIILVENTRPARGEIRVAHILAKIPPKATKEDIMKAKAKIDEIYSGLKSGQPFAKMAKTVSDDKSSARKYGVLPWFSTGRMVPKFEDVAFSLKNDDDISQPFRTQFGWHIIKRLEKKGIESLEKMRDELKRKVSTGARGKIANQRFVQQIKQEYKFHEFPKARKMFYNRIDDDLLIGKWDIKKAGDLNNPLFNIGEVTYTQQDLAQYIAKKQVKRSKMTRQKLFDNLYNQFADGSCLKYEEDRLEQKYPEFNALMKEYRDGILLFELTDQMVWTKAVKDTGGLKAFYEKNKESYMWEERLQAYIFTSANEDVAKKVRKMAKKKKYSIKEIKTEINKEKSSNLKFEKGKYLKADNKFIDAVDWGKMGITDFQKNGDKVIFVKVIKYLPKQIKALNESRGLVIADYQSYLEKEWIKELRNKFTVVVNKEVFAEILKNK